MAANVSEINAVFIIGDGKKDNDVIIKTDSRGLSSIN